MRIGRTIIDTDNMTIDEISTLINELREIRRRKQKAEELVSRMTELLADAKAEGFDFIDKDYGNVITPNDLSLYEHM